MEIKVPIRSGGEIRITEIPWHLSQQHSWLAKTSANCTINSAHFYKVRVFTQDAAKPFLRTVYTADPLKAAVWAEELYLIGLPTVPAKEITRIQLADATGAVRDIPKPKVKPASPKNRPIEIRVFISDRSC